jgi:3-hydroxyisobutyrate dehydrogenase
MSDKPVLSYIGLGLMGLPMAKHLLSQGYSVHGFDINPDAQQQAKKHGVKIHADIQSTVLAGNIVLLNLPTFHAVEEVVFGDHGVAKVIRPPQCIIDFSTNPVNQGRVCIDALSKQTGCAWIDAPVSGGPVASGNGSLTVMVGANTQDFVRVENLLKNVSARLTLVGPPGSGLVAKTLNQLIVGCLHAVIAESAVLAEQAGIDASCIPVALAGGHADGILFQQIFPRMLAKDFSPRGYARQLLKDLDMVQSFAADLKIPTPMTAQAQTLYRMLVHMGHAELDTSAIVKVIDR